MAFSGEHEFGSDKVTEGLLNGFPSGRIAAQFQENPYRFLVCADKFQTGYDEPLLHTMYVDKTLSGIKAVQTLSRLNRSHPEKHDAFVLDFLNDADTMRDAFADYYRATILADETDPDKLHDLQADLDGAQVYSGEQVDDLVRRYLGGAGARPARPDPRRLRGRVQERPRRGRTGAVQGERQGIRAHLRLSVVGTSLQRRGVGEALDLPELSHPEAAGPRGRGPVEGDPRRHRPGQLPGGEAGDAEDPAAGRADAEVDPVPAGGGGSKTEPELDRLSNILRAFNDLFGDIDWADADRVGELITRTIPSRVAADTAFRNAQQNSDRENARIEHDKALLRVMTSVMKDDTELFKQYMDNPGFKRWVADTVFEIASEQATAG